MFDLVYSVLCRKCSSQHRNTAIPLAWMVVTTPIFYNGYRQDRGKHNAVQDATLPLHLDIWGPGEQNVFAFVCFTLLGFYMVRAFHTN
jgi:hypothetical protein